MGVVTGFFGLIWITVKLFFGLRKLRREERVQEAEARAAEAEAEARQAEAEARQAEAEARSQDSDHEEKP